MPNADAPAPFPSLQTPTASTDLPKPATSYDDLVRRRVPLPDSSHRPTAAAELDAATPKSPTISVDGGVDAFPNDAHVRTALAALAQYDLADVTVSLAGGTATLTGSVARGLDRDAITAALVGLSGVTDVVDHLLLRTE